MFISYSSLQFVIHKLSAAFRTAEIGFYLTSGGSVPLEKEKQSRLLDCVGVSFSMFFQAVTK